MRPVYQLGEFVALALKQMLSLWKFKTKVESLVIDDINWSVFSDIWFGGIQHYDNNLEPYWNAGSSISCEFNEPYDLKVHCSLAKQVV